MSKTKTILLTLIIGSACFMGGCLTGMTMTVACFLDKGYRLQPGQDDPLEEFARARQEHINNSTNRTKSTEEHIQDVKKIQEQHERLRNSF